MPQVQKRQGTGTQMPATSNSPYTAGLAPAQVPIHMALMDASGDAALLEFGGEDGVSG